MKLYGRADALIREIEEEYRQLGTVLRFLRGRAERELRNGATPARQRRRRRRTGAKRQRGKIIMLVREELNTKPQPLREIMRGLQRHRVTRPQVASALSGLRRAGHVVHSDEGWSIRPAS